MSSNTGIRLLVIVAGFWIVMRSVNKDAGGRTLIDHILGQAGGANQPLPAATAAASTASAGPAKAAVDPIPGATGNRLDQGFDVTSKKFVAPFAGTVVASEQSDSGWQGGGYIAIQSASKPSLVEYFAEGLSPLLPAGSKVVPGQRIAVPTINPYNGVLGSIETGPADPNYPLRPLAQVVKGNPAGVVDSFYQWLRSLGAPKATSTSGAGYP